MLARSKRVYCNTIAQPPTSSAAAALERMLPVASDHRGRGAGWINAGMRPSHWRGELWWWVVSCSEGASTAVMRQSVIRLRLQLRLVGGRRCVGSLQTVV